MKPQLATMIATLRYAADQPFPIKFWPNAIALPAGTIGSHGINPGKRKEAGEFIVGNRVENPFPPIRAWLSRDGVFFDLHTHLSAVQSGANDVNDHGVVAGWAVMAQGGAAFRFDPASDQLEFLAGGESNGFAINAQGHVAGTVGSPGARKVFLHDGSLTLLPTLAGTSPSFCWAINDHDVVVGWRDLEDGSTHAFRYDHATQEIVDLHVGFGGSQASGVNNISAAVPGRSGSAPKCRNGVAR